MCSQKEMWELIEEGVDHKFEKLDKVGNIVQELYICDGDQAICVAYDCGRVIDMGICRIPEDINEYMQEAVVINGFEQLF